jgi:hypothetical protein
MIEGVKRNKCTEHLFLFTPSIIFGFGAKHTSMHHGARLCTTVRVYAPRCVSMHGMYHGAAWAWHMCIDNALHCLSYQPLVRIRTLPICAAVLFGWQSFSALKLLIVGRLGLFLKWQLSLNSLYGPKSRK